MFKVSPSARSALSRRHRRLAPHLPQDVSPSNLIFRRIMCQSNLIFRRMCLSRSPSSAERVSVEPDLPQDVSRSNPNFRRIMCQSNLIFQRIMCQSNPIFRRACLGRSPSSARINWGCVPGFFLTYILGEIFLMTNHERNFPYILYLG